MFYDEEDYSKKYGDFLVVRFLLASKIRPKLLLLLSDSNYDLNSFRKDLDKPSASILHGLKELESANLIKRSFKNYSLTSKGVLCSASLEKLFQDLYIFQSNRDYWLSHSIESIPPESFKNAYLIKDSIFVESDEQNLSKSLMKYLDLLSTCSDMKIILPIFLEDHLEVILENLEKGSNLVLITNNRVLSSLRESNYYEKLVDYSKRGNVSIRKTDDDLKLFLTSCDNGMALNLFFIDGLFDNSCCIFNENPEGIIWANILPPKCSICFPFFTEVRGYPDTIHIVFYILFINLMKK